MWLHVVTRLLRWHAYAVAPLFGCTVIALPRLCGYTVCKTRLFRWNTVMWLTFCYIKYCTCSDFCISPISPRGPLAVWGLVLGSCSKISNRFQPISINYQQIWIKINRCQPNMNKDQHTSITINKKQQISTTINQYENTSTYTNTHQLLSINQQISTKIKLYKKHQQKYKGIRWKSA